MTNERKQEIVNDLMDIYNDELPKIYGIEWSIFALMSLYRKSGKNKEKINGDWVIENCPEPLKSLPH